MSASMPAKADTPSIKRLRFDLHGGKRTYYWTQSDRVVHDEDAYYVKRDQTLRLILVNNTRMDYILNFSGHRFQYISGKSSNEPSSGVYLTAGNRTVIEVPGSYTIGD